MRILITIALFFGTYLSSMAQLNANLNNTEEQVNIDQNRIEYLANLVLQELPRKEKDSLNQLLLQELSFETNVKEAFQFSFNGVKSISILTSPDSAFRIFNWEISYLDGTNRYECLLLKKMGNSYELERLQPYDSIVDREVLMNKQLNSQNWLSALYYKIIP